MVLQAKLDRRKFLKTSTKTGGALILGFYFPVRGQTAGTGVGCIAQDLQTQRMAENFRRQSDHRACGKTRAWTGLAHIHADDDRGGIGSGLVHHSRGAGPNHSFDLSGFAYRWQRRRGKYVYADA